VESLCGLARGLSRQYWGALLMPRAPEDAWLVEGLAGWLEGQVGGEGALWAGWVLVTVQMAAGGEGINH
jgi:hypothetical protein